MNYTKQKLFMAGLSLTLAVIMVVTASLAWFTISTNPEISGLSVTLYTDIALLVSDEEEGEYGQVIYLDEEFVDYVGLKPISTVNGLEWFIATYDSDGELNPVEEFALADETNLNVEKPLIDAYTNESDYYLALEEAINNGYYISTTFWLMTEEDGGVDVRLSVPDVPTVTEYDKDGEIVSQYLYTDDLDGWETAQGTFGTYALSNYSVDGEEEESTLMILDKAAQTALRVGFLVESEVYTYDAQGAIATDESGDYIMETVKEFFIYEPNGDQRSSDIVKPTGITVSDVGPGAENEETTGYVVGFQKTEDNYVEGDYLTTTPIGYVYDEDTEEDVISLVDIESKYLTVQSGSVWNYTALQEAISQGINPDDGWSNYLETMGRFALDTDTLIEDEGFYEENSGLATTSAVIVSLAADTPKMVTMFIWIEGQDPDCWNDIAASSLVLNLELAATLK